MAVTSGRALTVKLGAGPVLQGIELPAASNTVGRAGTIAVTNSSGYAQEGSAALNLICQGVFSQAYDNTGGADGAILTSVRLGVFGFDMGTGPDALTNASRGAVVYIIDNATVGATNGGGTRSVAGILIDVQSNGSDPQAFVQMGAYLANGIANSGDMSLSGIQTVTGAKSFGDGTLLVVSSGGTFYTTLHSNATANRDLTAPDIASATMLVDAGTQTVTGVKTFASGADPVFAKEANHTINVVTTTTAATAGGALSVVGGAGATSGAGGAANLTGGIGGSSGAGGAAAVAGGAGGSASGNGGAASLTGGVGTAGNGVGGAAAVAGGAGNGSGNGGAASVTGGLAGGTGVGGAASLIAGAGGATSGNGGAVSVTGGAGTNGNGVGGAASVTGGAGNGSGNGGALALAAGAAGATGTGGAVTIAGGVGGATSGAGGATTVAGGAGTLNANGGALSLQGGAKNGSGTDGAISIGTSAGVITMGKSGNIETHNGPLAFAASAQLIADPGTGVAIPVTRNGVCAVTIGSAGAETNTLAIPGYIGQELSICADVVGTGTRVITVATAINPAGNNTITLAAAGGFIALRGMQVGGLKVWRVMATATGCTLSTA